MVTPEPRPEQQDLVVGRDDHRRQSAQQLDTVELRRLGILLHAIGAPVDLLRLAGTRCDDLDHVQGIFVARRSNGGRIGYEHEIPCNRRQPTSEILMEVVNHELFE